MAKWENCVVHVGGFSSHVMFFDVAGSKRSLISQDEAEDETEGDQSGWDAAYRYIAELGIEGWEVVSVSEGQYFLKRPKED